MTREQLEKLVNERNRYLRMGNILAASNVEYTIYRLNQETGGSPTGTPVPGPGDSFAGTQSPGSDTLGVPS